MASNCELQTKGTSNTGCKRTVALPLAIQVHFARNGVIIWVSLALTTVAVEQYRNIFSTNASSPYRRVDNPTTKEGIPCPN
ncbi:MAG: hypothetical protein MUO64_11040 [Anaerolineales bacterium]|nr:hypothetical protein [Anaerolineales bacterium]